MSTAGTKLAKAAGIIMIAMALSRILGYVRDVVILTKFGQNSITDAYNAAFSIPDFLYMLLVGGALSSAFIPVFSGYIATDREEEGWEVASTIFNIVMVLMLIGIGIGLIFTPSLIYLLVPKLKPESLQMAVTLTRIMFIQTFFMGMNGIAMGLLNSYKQFLAPALGSVLYNLGIIVVGVLLSPHLGPRWGIAAFSVGVVVGAFVNFAVQIPSLIKIGLRYKPIFNLKHPGVRQIGLLMLPVMIGLSVTQFNLFVNQNLASGLSEGIITALRTAQRLMQLPIGIFAIAIAVAVFPTLTAHAARGQKEAFRRDMSLGIRSVIFITLPSGIGLIALAGPIVQLLFEQGQFSRANTAATAYALMFYAIGLFAYSAIQFLSRVFYSLKDTRTPVVIGIFTIFVNIALNFLLIGPMKQGGLALGYSVAGIVNLIILLVLLRRKIGSIDGSRLLSSFTKTLAASLAMGAAAYEVNRVLAGALHFHAKLNQVIAVGGAISMGVVVFAVLVFLLRMEEVDLVLDLFRRRFQRARVGAKA